MRYLAAVVVLVLASCTMVKKAEDTLDKANAVLTEVKTDYIAARAEADTDGDGKVSGGEWLNFLLGILGVGTVGGSAIIARNAKSNARKDVIESRVKALEDNRI